MKKSPNTFHIFKIKYLLLIQSNLMFFFLQMQDMSDSYVSIKGAILQSIDDAEMESFDTSTSTEGENTTPIASPLPMNSSDFEITIFELIDNQR